MHELENMERLRHIAAMMQIGAMDEKFGRIERDLVGIRLILGKDHPFSADTETFDPLKEELDKMVERLNKMRCDIDAYLLKKEEKE